MPVIIGAVVLCLSQNTLIDQLRHYPKADHDDGPDALEMLWKAAQTGGTVNVASRARRSGGRGTVARGYAS